MAFSPESRLPTPPLSCALCRGCAGLGPEAGTQEPGLSPFSSVPNSFLLGTTWPKVWPRKSRPIPTSLTLLYLGFPHCEMSFPSDWAPESRAVTPFWWG